jgi:thiamine monophosphate kinase
MSQSIKEELVQTLDRLSQDKLLAVLYFVRTIEPQAAAQMAASADVSDAEAERAIADFLAAAGCGHSGDAQSSLRIDEVLYGRQGTP